MEGTSIPEVLGSDVFFEIIEPGELGYTYRLRPAKDFGAPFVCIHDIRTIAHHFL